MSAHKWQFASRFRRHAFGWRSDTPVQLIKEAITEIKQVARKEPVLAAEGAITLLEKLSPALEQVDSSSGALGSAVNKAIDTLVRSSSTPTSSQSCGNAGWSGYGRRCRTTRCPTSSCWATTGANCA